jgi:Arc/MetJ-type ribon-helix-helix transcriptional regulator
MINDDEDVKMEKVKIISVKVPQEVYDEMLLRIPEGERSNFVRDAILEKLEQTPKPNKILELEQRMGKIEAEFSELRRYLSDLELLTFEREKANPHTFAIDDMDHKIIDYLIHYKSATTPELAEYLKTNRWLVLNRLRRIQKLSRKQLGKSIIDYCAGEKSGKKKAWWISEELIEQ